MKDVLIAGLDVGTQGARLLVSDARGHIVAQGSARIEGKDADLPDGWAEQDPDSWWRAIRDAVQKALTGLAGAGGTAQEIQALCVDSTSGTLLALDPEGVPLISAIMYNDQRATEEAAVANDAGRALTEKLGYRFGASFGLPKIMWIKKHQPEVFERTDRFVHAGDWVVGKLTGDFSHSDPSNALKSGYDLVDRCWPSFIEDALGIPHSMLPTVVPTGTEIGRISKSASEELGLSTETSVVAGMTDGTASFFSTGGVEVGAFASTIGTTLVLKGVAEEIVRDPEGRIYCHVHPDGYWLPGGASSTGAECLTLRFQGHDLGLLTDAVETLPSGLIVYPLVRKGERFPFVEPEAGGFIVGHPRGEGQFFAAHLEGVAFVERWCYEVMEELGARVEDPIRSAGGGSQNPLWLQIRANVLGRMVVRPEVIEAAFGGCLVAARALCYPTLADAARAMVRIQEEVSPDSERRRQYDDLYWQFRAECAKRGYGSLEMIL